jgi:hypothetical protein
LSKSTNIMLIRVDVYPGDGINNGRQQQLATTGTPSTTLHACLATVSENDTEDKGCLLRVGRKTGNVIFEKDKTVSRSHCLVRCISTNPNLNVDHAMKPRTGTEEEEACDASKYGMCLVLENASKAGTFVAVADTSAAATDSKDEEEKEDGGDSDTDEEGISQQSRSNANSHAAVAGGAGAAGSLDDLPPLSSATQSFWGSSPVKFIKLDAGDTHILDLEGSGNHCTSNGDEASSDIKTVFVQFGRGESTIAITLIPLHIAFSRVKPRDLAEWQPKLPLLGALPVPDNLPSKSTTHLVTTERTPGAKQLIAFQLEIPMVSLLFLQAMMDRSSPADPLPDPNNCLPKLGDLAFWDDKPNANLWAEYSFLSIESNDVQALVASAGARVVPLYDCTQKKAVQKAQDLLASNSNTACCFAIDSKTSSFAKKLAKAGVPMVSAKNVAAGICSQRARLKDVDGNFIGPALHDDHDDDNDNGDDQVQPMEQDHDDSPGDAFPDSELQTQQQDQILENIAEEEEPCSSSNTGTMADDSASLHPAETENSTKSLQQESEQQQMMQDNAKEESEAQKPNKKTAAKAKDDRRPLMKSTKSSTAPPERLGQKDKEGWFVAAPKNERKRKEWRQRASKDYLAETGGQKEWVPAAPTETVCIVVQPRNAPEQRPSLSTYTGANFKRFRKNIVTKIHPRDRISLKTHMPKATKQLQQLEEQNREMEEQQRIADELFGGTFSKTLKKKRRS